MPRSKDSYLWQHFFTPKKADCVQSVIDCRCDRTYFREFRVFHLLTSRYIKCKVSANAVVWISNSSEFSPTSILNIFFLSEFCPNFDSDIHNSPMVRNTIIWEQDLSSMGGYRIGNAYVYRRCSFMEDFEYIGWCGYAYWWWA